MQKVCLTMPEVLLEAGLQMLRASINWIHNVLNVVVKIDNHVGKDVDLSLDLNRLRRDIFITGFILIMELIVLFRVFGYVRKKELV